VLGQEVLGIEGQDDLLFEIFVHLGTAFSIVTLYGRRLGMIVTQTVLAVPRPIDAWRRRPDTRMGLLILLTMVPTGVVYLLLSDRLEAAFENPHLVCGMLLVTGFLLLLTVAKGNARGKLSPLKALVVGIAQSAAFLPGISRSGATICAALYQNVEPRLAADFSFLMSVPVIFGAALVKGLQLFDVSMQAALVPIVIGTVVAYFSGILAIRLVLSFVKRGRLHYFAYYCFGVGILGLFLV